MKIIRTLLVALTLLLSAQVSTAQFKIGPKVGLTVSELHFNSDVFDETNRAGFTAGLMTEFTIPVVGIGFDASLLYSRRNAQWLEKQGASLKDGRDYISIPINLKWKFKLPIIKPFVTTGPDFAFLTSRRAINEAYRNRKFDTSWNVGFGAEILGHLQIAANYGFGINKALNAVGLAESPSENTRIEAKNRVWTITAAYLF